jgi:hypothetical protein
MKVAILGTAGIPASYPGFETAVEQISSRLVGWGHEVSVYCRPHVVPRSIKEWKGARLVHVPTLRNKYLNTFVHTLISGIHAAVRVKSDVARYFIAGNSPLCMITRAAGIRTVINVDGLDSDRGTWNRTAKWYLRLAARLAPRIAHRAITDSHAVAHIYEQRYRRAIGVVPYGAEARRTRARRRSTGSASSQAATCCSSAGSSPRTTRTCWSRPGRASRPSGRTA